MDLSEIVKHPLASIIVGIGAIAQLGFGLLEPGWTLLSTTAAYWFPAAATAGSTILPEFGYADLGTKILLGSAIAYVGVQLNRLINHIQNWLQDR